MTETEKAETARTRQFVATLVGRTITAADYWNDDDGSSGASVTLTLDDGRRISIDAWGHDYWGLTVGEDPA